MRIDDCGTDGLFAATNARFDEISNLVLTNTAGAPARMSVYNVRALDGSSALFAGTGDKHVRVFGDRIDDGIARVWRALDAPGIRIADGAAPSALIAVGTPNAPIVDGRGGTAPDSAALALDAPLFATTIRLDQVSIEDATYGVWVDEVNSQVNILECLGVTLTDVTVPLSGNDVGTWTTSCGPIQ